MAVAFSSHGLHGFINTTTKPRIANCSTKMNASDIQILQINDNFVAVNKPAGMLVHRTKLDKRTNKDTRFLVNELRELLTTDIFPVHRLDRCTSGVMLFALHNSENAARLQDALQQPSTMKRYWALTAGDCMPQTWVNEHPLKDLTGSNRKQRSAKTEFERLLCLDDARVNVVRALLRSGRRHQVRRHLSNSRYEILGDTSYARGALNRHVREAYGVSRCCLHSRRLSIVDPFGTDETLHFAADVPEDLTSVLRNIPGYVAENFDHLVDLTDSPK